MRLLESVHKHELTKLPIVIGKWQKRPVFPQEVKLVRAKSELERLGLVGIIVNYTCNYFTKYQRMILLSIVMDRCSST